MSRRIEVELIGTDKSLSRTFAKSEKNAKKFAISMNGVVRSTGGFSRGFLSGAGALSSFGGALALTSGSFFAGAGLVAGLKAAVGAAGDFQQKMNVLQQVTGATAREMAAVSLEARRLGADISLPATSASDAAEAMLQLSKGGLTLRDSMAAARGTLQLAAAAQTDVGTAANTSARAITAFGLSGKDAGAIADALANAANAATGDINDFAIALSQSATSGHAFGLTAQDTVTALTELAKAGLVGSDAGTSLRVMLSRLLPTSVAAKREMHKLGVSVHDANGQFLPFRKVIENYNKQLSKLTPATRQHALQVIFGTDAQRAANIIFGKSVGTFDQYEKAISKTGGAARAAAAQQKGFKGAVDGFNSALQTTGVAVGTTLLPMLTKYLRQGATWLSDTRNQKKITDDVTKSINFMKDAVKLLVGVVKTVDKVTGSFKNTMELLLGLKVVSILHRWTAALAGFEIAAGGGAGAKGVTTLGAKLREIAQIGVLSLGFRFPGLATQLSKIALLRGSLGKLALVRAITIPVVIAITAEFVGKKLHENLDFSPGSLLKDIKNPFKNAKGPLINAIIGNGFVSDKELAERHAQIAAGAKREREAIKKMLRNARGGIGGAIKDTIDVLRKSLDKVLSEPTKGGGGGGGVKLTAEQRNTFFDNSIARILLRGGLGSISQQIAALEKANGLIAARIKSTKDVTRKLTLEDELLQNQAQITSLKTQAAAEALQKRQDVFSEFIANLQLGVTKAQATSGLNDDLSSLKALEAGIRKEIKAFGRTAELTGQLFDAQQQIKDARQRQIDAKQFFTLGLGPTGGDRVPLVKSLRKQLANVSDAVQGTFLDTNKTRSVLANIKKVLGDGVHGVSSEVRSKIQEMLDSIDQQLGDHARNLTKFKHVNSAALINALGLNLSAADKKRLQAAFDQIGAGGTVPGGRSGAFAGSGAANVTVETTVNLDGSKVAKNTTKHQRRQGQRRSESRRGPYAGRN